MEGFQGAETDPAEGTDTEEDPEGDQALVVGTGMTEDQVLDVKEAVEVAMVEVRGWAGLMNVVIGEAAAGLQQGEAMEMIGKWMALEVPSLVLERRGSPIALLGH